ncbi:hypothetical protein EK904_004683, partial [Melospiza melodia maxima]
MPKLGHRQVLAGGDCSQLIFMLPILFSAFILSACCTAKGNCISYDELRELKTEFAISLYRQVSEAENRTNLVVSPASVAASLELLQFGAQGNTFTELQDVLGYSIHDQSVQDFMHTVDEAETDSSQGTVVQLGCSLLVDAGVQLSPDFAERAARWANSSLLQTNLTDPNATHTQEWITTDLAGQFQTAALEAFSVVELPYLGEKLSMFLVLPSHKRTPLSQIESHLSTKTITFWANSLKRTKMDIFLPRFSIQSLFDLKTILSALGIRDAFDPITANFKGISEQDSLYISEAIHKAEIEVTEDGTKASGST